MKWKTKTGRLVDIRNMTTDHINNVLRCIREGRFNGSVEALQYYFVAFRAELARRREEAIDVEFHEVKRIEGEIGEQEKGRIYL